MNKETLNHNDTTVPSNKKCKGRILLMDDDETVRMTTLQMLTFIGYEAEGTEDGESAIECYHSAMKLGTPFDLLVMDLNIPDGMGAIEAAQEIFKLDKNAKIIVCSGDSMDPAMHNYAEYGFSASLAKPFEFALFHKLIGTLITS